MDNDTFTVTHQHMELLKRANVGWEDCEFGAPAIDCKRPYGNSSVYEDIAYILGVPLEEDEYGQTEIGPNLREQFDRVHKGTQTALQIFLAVGYMKAGRYEAKKYTNEWKEATT